MQIGSANGGGTWKLTLVIRKVGEKSINHSCERYCKEHTVNQKTMKCTNWCLTQKELRQKTKRTADL